MEIACKMSKYSLEALIPPVPFPRHATVTADACLLCSISAGLISPEQVLNPAVGCQHPARLCRRGCRPNRLLVTNEQGHVGAVSHPQQTFGDPNAIIGLGSSCRLHSLKALLITGLKKRMHKSGHLPMTALIRIIIGASRRPRALLTSNSDHR